MRMFLKITDVEKKSKIRPLRTETKLTNGIYDAI